MDYLLDEDMYTNEVQYFFSLHGPRFEYMNNSMADSLGKRFGKEFKPIRILNAWPSEQYHKANYIVLNERSYRITKKLGQPVVYLPDYEDVNVEFSQNSFILEISRRLLEKQDTIFVYPFTTAFLDLPNESFTVLGPNSELAKSLDNKINQHKVFSKLGLPCNNTRVFNDTEDLLAHEDEIIPSYISAAYSSGGNESALVYTHEMLHEFLAKLRPINKNNSIVVADIFSDISLAPNVNALITGDGKVVRLMLSDQILQGNRYLGNIYPTEASEANKREIYRITEIIGQYLASQGYRGLFGLDFLINRGGELVLIDLNPRHQGGYACNGLALQTRNISLTDMELSNIHDEEITVSQDVLDEYLGFAWSHSKIVPNEVGQVINNEHHQNSISDSFSDIGKTFVTCFYKKGSVFVDGYIGYQVQTAQKRENLEATALQAREQFDKIVLGVRTKDI